MTEIERHLALVGTKIKKHRELKYGTSSKSEFCDIMEMSRPSLDKIESTGQMSLHTFMRIAKELSVRPQTLFPQ